MCLCIRCTYCRDLSFRNLTDNAGGYLSAGKSQLTLCVSNLRCAVENDADGALRLEIRRSVSGKAEQTPLLRPVGGEMRGQPQQFRRRKFLRLPAIDDRRGDIGCEPGQAQQRVKVCRAQASRSRDVTHIEFRVSREPCLEFMGASNKFQQARIEHSLCVPRTLSALMR